MGILISKNNVHVLWKMLTPTRGVQYVHFVMHECIMVKVGGNVKDKKDVKHK